MLVISDTDISLLTVGQLAVAIITRVSMIHIMCFTVTVFGNPSSNGAPVLSKIYNPIVLPRYFDHVYIFVFVNIVIKTMKLFICNGWLHTLRL